MDPLSQVLARHEVPSWARVKLLQNAEHVDAVGPAVAAAFAQPGIGERIQPGMRVALAAGSRGIDRIGEVVGAAVAEVKRRGGLPFIVPAMGSHGGAVAEEQVNILAHYGITEAAMGCEIRSSMEVVELGRLESGQRIFSDRIAATQADLVIPIGRVKPHTDFHGPVESGLLKMLAIGLGKQTGADNLHASGFDNFPWLVPAAGEFVLTHLPVPFGLALVENGYCRLSLVEAVPAAAIPTREVELLQIARARMARLPVDRLDVLVIDEIGKEISGASMDPNVLGRYFTQRLPGGPEIQRVVVLGLTESTEGNAAGIGMADICTRRAADTFDPIKTYINVLTSKTPEGGKLPLIARNDREALQMAVSSLWRADPAAIRLMRIRNTKELSTAWVSEAALPDALASGRAEQLGPVERPVFDGEGNLA